MDEPRFGWLLQKRRLISGRMVLSYLTWSGQWAPMYVGADRHLNPEVRVFRTPHKITEENTGYRRIEVSEGVLGLVIRDPRLTRVVP